MHTIRYHFHSVRYHFHCIGYLHAVDIICIALDIICTSSDAASSIICTALDIICIVSNIICAALDIICTTQIFAQTQVGDTNYHLHSRGDHLSSRGEKVHLNLNSFCSISWRRGQSSSQAEQQQSNLTSKVLSASQMAISKILLRFKRYHLEHQYCFFSLSRLSALLEWKKRGP